MRTYEVLFIVAPNAPEADVDRVTDQLRQTVADAGGTVTKLDKLGRRRLAYNIGKFREGDYILAVIESNGREVAEVERRLRVADVVLRYISVRVDEDVKRADKLKAARQAAVAARPPRRSHGQSHGHQQMASDMEAEAEE
ncbi:MAG TPA: 30S ribosomal protein S6 [Blastocatellia bacterium]|nr:30S ribosomal protein S6 [Blastocatellia bacterium]